jgi:hypothetical protein
MYANIGDRVDYIKNTAYALGRILMMITDSGSIINSSVGAVVAGSGHEVTDIHDSKSSRSNVPLSPLSQHISSSYPLPIRAILRGLTLPRTYTTPCPPTPTCVVIDNKSKNYDPEREIIVRMNPSAAGIRDRQFHDNRTLKLHNEMVSDNDRRWTLTETAEVFVSLDAPFLCVQCYHFHDDLHHHEWAETLSTT